jgi:hypothetical protein
VAAVGPLTSGRVFLVQTHLSQEVDLRQLAALVAVGQTLMTQLLAVLTEALELEDRDTPLFLARHLEQAFLARETMEDLPIRTQMQTERVAAVEVKVL